ncbi:ABC transporter ATP-binding protein [Candidatus Saccharibacteria bacterium]|nr:ABC transporter ATP-binding protein [Candidatus Saccharibacteria bacterium]
MSKKRQSTTRRTLHYFWQATKKHKLYTAITFITSPIVVLFRGVITPLLISIVVGEVVNNPSKEYIIENLVPFALLIIGLRIIFSAILGELRIWAHWKMEIYAMYDLANMAFDTISAQSMQFHSNRFSGSLVSQTNKFISAYERFFDSLVWSVIQMVVVIVASLAVLYAVAPLFAVGLTILIIGYSIIAYVWFKKMKPLNEKVASTDSLRTGQLSDSISNIAAVKSYASEEYEHSRYAKYNHFNLRATINLLHANIKRNSLFDVIYIGITANILVFLLIGQAWLGISFATLYLMISYSLNIVDLLWDLNNVFKDMNRVFGDAKEMTEILDLKDDVVDLPGATKLEVSRAAIDFDDITFKHSDAKVPVFSNFSLEVKPGERIGLVGVSGSGKTTLTKLLLRFADVNQGKITIDGQDIKHVTQASLRKNIAYVPQETALFHRSISDNIAYGKPDATAEEIKRAAKLANADEFIKDLPSGYDTLVGERGIKLSGGQRQRIAIARAILKDAPILVLDEATSALDSESEALIQGALKELIKDRTSIVIAHRLSTVMDLDRIVVLENGKIVETGTHAELLKKGGAYARLWSRQSGAFLDEN